MNSLGNMVGYSKEVLERLRIKARQDGLLSGFALLIFCVPLAVNVLYIEQFDMVKYLLTCLGVGLVWLGFLWRKERVAALAEPQKKVFLLLMSLFVLWSVLATVFAYDRLYALIGFYNRFPNSLLFHVLFAALCLAATWFEGERRRVLLSVFVCGGAFSGLWSIIGTLGIGVGSTGSAIIRAPGLLGNTNFTALYFAALVPVAVWLCWTSASRRARVWYGLASIFMFAAMAFASSRGAVLGFAAAGLYAAIMLLWHGLVPRKRVLKLFLLACVCIIFSVGVLVIARPQIGFNTLSGADKNVSDRARLLDMGVSAVTKRPVFGTGLGNAFFIFERERPAAFRTDAVYDDMHNVFLQWAVTGGVPLMLIMLAIIVFALSCGFSKMRAGQTESLALSAGVVAWVVAALFTPLVVAHYLVLAVFVGFLCAGDILRPVAVSRISRVCGIVACSVFIVLALTAAAGEFFAGYGRSAYWRGDYAESSAALAWAVRLNPTNPYARLFHAGAVIQSRESEDTVVAVVNALASQHPKYNRTALWLVHLKALEFYAHPNPKLLSEIGRGLNRVIEVEPGVRYYRYLKAQYYILNGSYLEAEADMRAQVQIDPSYYPGWLLLARIYQLEGNSVGFVEALGKAVELFPDPALTSQIEAVRAGQPVGKVPLQISNLLGSL